MSQATEPFTSPEEGQVETVDLIEMYTEIQRAVDSIERRGGTLDKEEFELVQHYAGIIRQTESEYMRAIALHQLRRHLKLLGKHE